MLPPAFFLFCRPELGDMVIPFGGSAGKKVLAVLEIHLFFY